MFSNPSWVPTVPSAGRMVTLDGVGGEVLSAWEWQPGETPTAIDPPPFIPAFDSSTSTVALIGAGRGSGDGQIVVGSCDGLAVLRGSTWELIGEATMCDPEVAVLESVIYAVRHEGDDAVLVALDLGSP